MPEALSIARQLDLDLVEVASEANPPVCRIMDYGKFRFDQAQRAKESRRKTTSTSIKEMKYRPKIGSGDFDTKTRQVAKFLTDGHKVKVTIMFRGREMSHPELGMRILESLSGAQLHPSTDHGCGAHLSTTRAAATCRRRARIRANRGAHRAEDRRFATADRR